ncbi:MAG: polysaccharide biosynthesis protein [Acidobacteriota bacterium]
MKRFLQQNFIILVLMNSGNVFNYLFQLTAGRAMTPDEFGSFNALNSMLSIIAAPMAIVPLIMARFTAGFALEGMGRVRGLFNHAAKFALAAAVVVAVLGVLAAPLMRDFLHFTEMGPVYVSVGMLVVLLLMPVPWGMLQGMQRFTGYGVSGASNACLRFVASLGLLTALGWGVSGAVLCGLIGAAAQTALAMFFLKDLLRVPATPLPPGFHREAGRYALGMVVSSVVGMCLNNLDLILVRHFCPGSEAGLYATAAILGRIAFFGPSVLVSVLFTEAATAKARGQEDNKSLWTSTGMTLLLGGGYALVCFLASKLVVTLLFGAQYEAAGPLLAVIAVAMAMLATANVFFVYSQARGEFGFMWLQGAGVALFAALALLYHESAMQVARMLLISMAFILASTLAWYGLKSRKPRPAV